MEAFYWIAVAVVTVVSASRVTRLLTWDKFPPILHLRDWYAEWTDKTDRRRAWQLLAFCGYCMSFWVTAVIVVLADLSGIFDGEPLAEWMTPAWWLINGTFAASYLAAILMTFDGDLADDGDDD